MKRMLLLVNPSCHPWPLGGTETEFFPTWKRDIDENQTNVPII